MRCSVEMARDEEKLFRLNRAIAATGYCSRRRADELIADGRISVNGKVTVDFNHLVDLKKDRLSVDGKPLQSRRHEYVLLYKPKGVITTCEDEKGRQVVLDLLPPELQHLKPVGRLDRDSEGLLLLTNDGDLTQHLTHPSEHVFKSYKVTVEGKITDATLKQLAEGVVLNDGITLPATVTLINREKDKSLIEISIREGRNRQVRRMLEALGFPVKRLVRVAIGALQLRQMAPGQWRMLSPQELAGLKRGLRN